MPSGINTTVSLPNSVRVQYIEDYFGSYQARELYSQIAVDLKGLPMAELFRGSSVSIPFLSHLPRGTTAIPSENDVVPTQLRDAVVTVTPTSRWGLIDDNELLQLTTYTDYGRKRFERIGANAADTIDLIAQDVALQGSLVIRATARASLDAGTAGHRASDGLIRKLHAEFSALGIPGFPGVGAGPTWAVILHPYAYHDIAASGLIDDITQYSKPEILLNFELGKIGPFRFVVDGRAKAFWSAGAANSSAVATTLASSANALATTITVASATNIAVGQWLTIGTIETGNTHYPTNERVYVTGVDSTTITVVGLGDNGGLMYDHTAGETVSNADSVFPMLFAGSASLARVYAVETGPRGQIVGPKSHGSLDQFVSLGWKFYGGFGRVTEKSVLRVEVSSSFEA